MHHTVLPYTTLTHTALSAPTLLHTTPPHCTYPPIPSRHATSLQVRKNLLNWLYPDAHDANENMGGAMEAYYDKATGKWVIPGEVRA